MIVANTSQLRNNLKDYISKVVDDNDTLVVNSNGKSIVIISLEEYNSFNETEYLLSTAENKKKLYIALEQSKNKKFKEVTTIEKLTSFNQKSKLVKK